MNMNAYLVNLLSLLTLIPSAILCFAPVAGRLKFKKRSVITALILIFAIILPLLSYVETSLSLSYNRLILLLMIVCFIVYNALLRTHFSQSLCCFVLVCALMSFMGNFAIGFDAYLHPCQILSITV